jgi:hypothetical protein
MDSKQFDELSRAISTGATRRGLVGLLAGVAGVGLAEVVAKDKHRGQARGQGNGKGGGQTKVTLCHKPGTPAEKTLTVPQPAVDAHLGHGDTLGPCGGGVGGCRRLDEVCGILAGRCCQGECVNPPISTCQVFCDSDQQCQQAFPTLDIVCGNSPKCGGRRCCTQRPCTPGARDCPHSDRTNQQCCDIGGQFGICCFPGQACSSLGLGCNY